MKLISLLIISFWALSVAGQIKPMKKKDAKVESRVSILPPARNKKVVNDTVPLVIYVKKENIDRQPAYYINGEISNPTVIKSINPDLIDSIHVVNRKIEINDKKYFGQIFLKMKDEYNPKLISLNNLKAKYTNLSNNPTIFFINNDMIKEDYGQYMVDENFILRIIVDNIENEKEKLNVNVIQLLTRTKENIEKSKEIRIRGLGETTLNSKTGR